MRKIYKITNIVLIFMLIMGGACSGLAYSYNISDLRTPLLCKYHNDRAKEGLLDFQSYSFSLPPGGILHNALANNEIRSILVLPYRNLTAIGDNLIRSSLAAAISSLGIDATVVVHSTSLLSGLPNITAIDFSEIKHMIENDILDITAIEKKFGKKFDLVIVEDPVLTLRNAQNIPYLLTVDKIIKDQGRRVSLTKKGDIAGRYFIPQLVNEHRTVSNIYEAFGFSSAGDEKLELSASEIVRARNYLDNLVRIGNFTANRFIILNPGVGRHVTGRGAGYRLEKVILTTEEWVELIHQIKTYDPGIIVLVGTSSAPDNEFIRQKTQEILKHFEGDDTVVNVNLFLQADWRVFAGLLRDPRVIMQIGFNSGTVQHLSDKVNEPSLALFAEHIDPLKFGGPTHVSWHYQKKGDTPLDIRTIMGVVRAVDQLKRFRLKSIVDEYGEEAVYDIARSLVARVEELDNAQYNRSQAATVAKIEDGAKKLMSFILDDDLKKFFESEQRIAEIRNKPPQLRAMAYEQTNLFKFAFWLTRIAEYEHDFVPVIKGIEGYRASANSI